MKTLHNLIPLAERVGIPDVLARFVIGTMVARTSRSLTDVPAGATTQFAREMEGLPIATHTREANTQHYELPAEFFELVLGPQRKYSCCYYARASDTLAEAETEALEETARRAQIEDGHSILDLGCGWGSFALFAARRFPNARVVAVSNSHAQRTYIERNILEQGLGNISVITADINALQVDDVFDRVVSIEMFEHMANWPRLLERIRPWITPYGRLFVHVFSHRHAPYRFDAASGNDWIGQHFFSGGIMPSHDLMAACASGFRLEETWRWNGQHYARTARHWIENFTTHAIAIDAILRDVYGGHAREWRQRWRLFFLATEGLFAHNEGNDWGVSHYRLMPAPAAD